MIINNGIINVGNNNTITSYQTNYQILEQELITLSKNCSDKNIDECLMALKEKDENKFKKKIKKLGKEALLLIKTLSLVALEKYIETLF